jgi:hypothetical protein
MFGDAVITERMVLLIPAGSDQALAVNLNCRKPNWFP